MIAGINALVDLDKAVVHPVQLPLTAGIKCFSDVLRIDKIHATVSGNKWFKLKYSLLQAISLHKTTIVTAGGAYSNHLVATAYACNSMQLKCIGIIRGEQPATLSPTLQECAAMGMQFHFTDRSSYTNSKKIFEQLNEPEAYFIEEGGSNECGVKGASEIMQLAGNNYSHICCAVGTGTMLAGLLQSTEPEQQVVGISALKLSTGNSIEAFIDESTHHKKNYTIHYDYHFGGYAKKNTALIDFMNNFYTQTGMPTDFVYTAKLFYAVTDLAAKGHFPAGSRLLVIHSGGLQGNRSLPKSTLIF
jgi:1-aminocyclopropane-1-carboxylate deaminase